MPLTILTVSEGVGCVDTVVSKTEMVNLVVKVER